MWQCLWTNQKSTDLSERWNRLPVSSSKNWRSSFFLSRCFFFSESLTFRCKCFINRFCMPLPSINPIMQLVILYSSPGHLLGGEPCCPLSWIVNNNDTPQAPNSCLHVVQCSVSSHLWWHSWKEEQDNFMVSVSKKNLKFPSSFTPPHEASQIYFLLQLNWQEISSVAKELFIGRLWTVANSCYGMVLLQRQDLNSFQL